MIEPKMHRLVFMNADSKPKNVALDLAMEAVPHVMAWYGAYFAGDRYTVALDGRNVHIDGNGEPVCESAVVRAAALADLAEADAPIVERE